MKSKCASHNTPFPSLVGRNKFRHTTDGGDRKSGASVFMPMKRYNVPRLVDLITPPIFGLLQF